MPINNNLNTFHNNSLRTKKKANNLDYENKIKYENLCLSDRIQNLNHNNKNSKHKRVMTNYKNELINICGNSKNNMNIKKIIKSQEKKEKIKKLCKAMKLILKNDNNKNQYYCLETDTNSNNNTSTSNTSKIIHINNNILKNVLNNINKKNIRKNSINQNDSIRKSQQNKLKKIQEKNRNKALSNLISSKRKEKKSNKKSLYHFKTNSNLLTKTIYKQNAYQSFFSNNSSISFHSPFIRRKMEKKLTSTYSYQKLKMSALKRRYKKKLLIQNCLGNKRKALSDLNYINVSKNKDDYKLSINENKSYLNEFSTQIYFKNNKNIIKDLLSSSKTKENSKNSKKEIKISLLTKNKKNNNLKEKTFIKAKRRKLGLRSRNNTLNSININLSNIKNLKISNNLFTTINIYEATKDKIRRNSKNSKGINIEKANDKIVNEIYCFENKKLVKKISGLNEYKYINKKNLSNNNFSNYIIKNNHNNHNKTNSIINNNLDSALLINKTVNNFNHLINKNLLLKKTYNYINKNKKIRAKNIQPSLLKKLDKDIICPYNSERIAKFYKNDSSKNKSKNDDSGSISIRNNKKRIILKDSEKKVNNKVRKLSNKEKKLKVVTNYGTSAQISKKIQKKIILNNFKQLIGNLN